MSDPLQALKTVTGVTSGVHGVASTKARPTTANGALQVASVAVSGVSGFVGTVTGSPFGAVVGTGVNVMIGAVLNGIDAADTQKTVAALKKLRKDVARLHDPEACQLLGQALELAITKKASHRNYAIADATVVGQIGTKSVRAVRGTYKKIIGTKGQRRRDAADIVLSYAKENSAAGAIARKIVSIVAHREFEDIMNKAVRQALKS